MAGRSHSLTLWGPAGAVGDGSAASGTQGKQAGQRGRTASCRHKHDTLSVFLSGRLMDGRERWSSSIGFILSTIGSAIGLGSIWKFPYEVGSNGGGAFLLFYILGLILVVVPLMLIEFAVGRNGRSDAVGSIAAVANASGASKYWQLLGALGILTSYLILSFYSVIGGWALYYLTSTAKGELLGGTAAEVQARFDSMLASPWAMTGCHLGFMAIAAVIVARGIANGIEAACKILMPILMALIVVLAVYSMSEGDIRSALRFLFAIQPSAVSAQVALNASAWASFPSA
jgi:neurotransmitter:Na+ symporter, NSS family